MAAPALLLRPDHAPVSPAPILGDHPLIFRLLAQIDAAARLSVPVVVCGPTGTGKELVVQELHRRSGLAGQLVAINMAALPEHLAESELFGSTRGAFTGASDRAGLVEAARGGTLYLDEAGDASPGVQVKLLRVIESGVIRRVGSGRERAVDFRLVVSTQIAPADLLARGRWREDFYYRIGGVHLAVPTLRQHAQDIPILINHFLRQLQHPAVAEEQLGPLLLYSWPGNVRELKRVVERAVASADGGVVGVDNLLDELPREVPRAPSGEITGSQVFRDLERRHFQNVLRECGGNVVKAARQLGISRSGAYYKLKKLRLISGR